MGKSGPKYKAFKNSRKADHCIKRGRLFCRYFIRRKIIKGRIQGILTYGRN